MSKCAILLCFATLLAAENLNSTAQLLIELIRIDTSNPPGNEGKLDDFLAAKFRPLGFAITQFPTPVAAKSHFIARLKGDGTKRPILVAAHADVVGVEREKWTMDPFAGIVKDGYVYGRGAIDFKGGIAVFASAILRLAQNHVPLHRDLIFMVEADEEAQPFNTSWLAQSHWDAMDAEFALNEGGWIIQDGSKRVRYVSISTDDKISVAMLLTAKGTSTHSSMPRPDSAIFSLSKALAKLADYDTQPRITESTREFLLTLAKTSQPPQSTYFRNLAESKDPKLVHQADVEISKNPLLHALIRNTLAPVFLNAGIRGNVIPGSAQATINFRIVPGTDPRELISEVQSVIKDSSIDVTISGSQTPTQREPSSKDTDLYRALVRSATATWPGAPVTPYLFQAGTDAVAWRSRGVPVYGIYPYPISSEDLTRMHGNDERVPIASLEQGTEFIYKTLLEVAAR